MRPFKWASRVRCPAGARGGCTERGSSPLRALCAAVPLTPTPLGRPRSTCLPFTEDVCPGTAPFAALFIFNGKETGPLPFERPLGPVGGGAPSFLSAWPAGAVASGGPAVDDADDDPAPFAPPFAPWGGRSARGPVGGARPDIGNAVVVRVQVREIAPSTRPTMRKGGRRGTK